MIKPGTGMAAVQGRNANAGWSARGEIRGFNQTHVSVTGDGPKYGKSWLSLPPEQWRLRIISRKTAAASTTGQAGLSVD